MEKTLITSKTEAENLYDTLVKGNFSHIQNETKESIMDDVSEFFVHKNDPSENLVLTQNNDLKTFSITVSSLKS